MIENKLIDAFNRLYIRLIRFQFSSYTCSLEVHAVFQLANQFQE